MDVNKHCTFLGPAECVICKATLQVVSAAVGPSCVIAENDKQGFAAAIMLSIDIS